MTTSTKPYVRLSSPTDLSVSSLAYVLGELGYASPVLHVHPASVVTAYEVVSIAKIPLAVKSDPGIGDTYEWWVEWNGKAYGSEGC